MKLYDFPFSPNSRKVRAVVYELGIRLDHVVVDLFKGQSRTPDFLGINPNGRIPVLVDGDFTLWESTAIMRYLGRDSALVPTAQKAAANVDRWIAWQLAHLGPAMSKVAFERMVKAALGRGAPDEARIAEGTSEFHVLTAILEGSLGDTKYVAGALTIADFALAAHYSLASGCGLELARYPRVEGWLARVCERDSMHRALADARAHAAP